MQFIAVSRNAAQVLASERVLQSAEFEQGGKLARRLLGHANGALSLPRLSTHTIEGSLCFVTHADGGRDALIFDLDASDLFTDVSDSEAIVVFQKVLRFALKHWNHQTLNVSERVIPGTSRAIVFPFPISTKSSFRVALELSPDLKRT